MVRAERRRRERSHTAPTGVSREEHGRFDVIPSRRSAPESSAEHAIGFTDANLTEVDSDISEFLGIPRLRERSSLYVSAGHLAPREPLLTYDQAYAHSAEELRRFTPVRYTRMPDNHPVMDANTDIGIDILSRWFTREYLGDRIFERFSRIPPILTTETREFFDIMDHNHGDVDAGGLYFPGTNHAMIRGDILDENDVRVIIAHEFLHYAVWLGCGNNIYVLHDREEELRTGLPNRIYGRIDHLIEGVVDLYALQLTIANGYLPTSVGYPNEVRAAFIMQRIVGAEVLLSAMLTGDYTAVREKLDGALGPGTFNSVVTAQRGLEAVDVLLERLSQAGIDDQQWNEGIIMRLAGRL